MISTLCWSQSAKLRVDNQNTQNIKIYRGVRQDCMLSPLPFNVYNEEVFKEALLDSIEDIISINGEILINLGFVDDTVIMKDNSNDLQNIIHRHNECCHEYGLKMNLKKTKCMIMTTSANANIQLTIEDTLIEMWIRTNA
ncbi:uncharacterized protein [Diabrotica undecimpunctata]|uniref:uncharacterized protein n=1 Tax=Diabrotica undecimpunctata TaxID=50387 RepID=UPI003B63CEB3